MKVLVAGSGPAGTFAALGALESGAEVLMVDPGQRLEENARALRDDLGSRHWTHWIAEDRERLQRDASLKVKRHFGSLFATRPLPGTAFKQRGCAIRQSHASGGLSHVWGRGIEPPYHAECNHWSFHGEFLRSLETVLHHLPLAAGQDNLARVMPLYKETPLPHPVTPEAELLLARWQARAEKLNALGVHFGRTRLALRTDGGCRLCGMCFYGCPYNAMYDSTEMLAALSRYPGFRYAPWHRVLRFEPEGEGVAAVTRNTKNNMDERLVADRLVLAAGSPETTLIAMRSLGVRRATLQCSEVITFPFLSLVAPRAERDAPMHSLSQLTLTVNNRFASTRAGAFHLYGRNPAVEQAALNHVPARLRPLARRLLGPVLARLFIGMCFLHSADSTPVSITDDGENALFSSRRTARGWFTCLRLWLFMLRIAPKTALLPLPSLRPLGVPGSSNHYGGSIPIGGQPPMAAENDGRLRGHPAIFIADAASLPEIPGGSYTLSIMANAHRIGKAAGHA